MSKIFHGGDIAGAEQRYGKPQQGWLDLSTGINPCSYPRATFAPEIWERLPEKPIVEALKQAASVYFNQAAIDSIVCAPGTQAIIQWLPRLHPKTKVAVVSPTYNEHAHCWQLAGHEVIKAATLESAETLGDIVIAVSPNNPDGRLYSPNEIAALADRLSLRGGLLILDAAFIDVLPDHDPSFLAGREGLVILRSFGKFFGLAGVRLGFALVGGALKEGLEAAIGPWAVSGPAIAIATQALADNTWIASTRERLQKDAKRLDGLLEGAGLSVLGGCDLFRLAEGDQAAQLYEVLARAGILVRMFPENERWLRFGLPGNDSDWARLESALKAP